MKLMKSALLGTSAALVAVAGAQAADLPSTKSAPVQYVRICDAYGAGFFFIPGTDTCLKIGGRVRFELSTQHNTNIWRHASVGGGYMNTVKFNGVNATPVSPGNAFLSKNGRDSLSWLARGYLTVDARTPSAWGTVQTVMTIRVNSQSGALAGNFTTGAFASTNAFTPSLDAAYVRFAGFTFGRAASNFTALPPLMYNTDYWGGFVAGIKQLAYTATFGGGFSATIALEDRQDMGSMVTANALGSNPVSALAGVPLFGAQLTSTAVGPSRLPNVVANIRVDQAWGWAQLSASVGQNTANVAGVASNLNPGQSGNTSIGSGALANVVNGNGPLVKKTGWAIAASARINLPMLAAGDNLQVTAGYSNGMLDMIGGHLLSGNVAKNGQYLGGLVRYDRSMTIFCQAAAVNLLGQVDCASVGSETTKAWNIGGQFTHFWTPTIRQTIAASYLSVTPGTVTRNTDWQQGGLSKAHAWTVGSNVTWSPVRGFDIGVELTYARLKQRLATDPVNFGGVPSPILIPTGAAACVGGGPACVAQLANFKVSPHIWNARLRVERNF